MVRFLTFKHLSSFIIRQSNTAENQTVGRFWGVPQAALLEDPHLRPSYSAVRDGARWLEFSPQRSLVNEVP